MKLLVWKLRQNLLEWLRVYDRHKNVSFRRCKTTTSAKGQNNEPLTTPVWSPFCTRPSFLRRRFWGTLHTPKCVKENLLSSTTNSVALFGSNTTRFQTSCNFWCRTQFINYKTFQYNLWSIHSYSRWYGKNIIYVIFPGGSGHRRVFQWGPATSAVIGSLWNSTKLISMSETKSRKSHDTAEPALRAVVRHLKQASTQSLWMKQCKYFSETKANQILKYRLFRRISSKVDKETFEIMLTALYLLQ